MNKKIQWNMTSRELKRIKDKYQLLDFTFDNECIYKPGDLSHLLSRIIQQTLPELTIEVTEQLSSDKEYYVATLKRDRVTLTISTQVHSDTLSDDFIEKIPVIFGSTKRFYPKISVGQDATYFIGTEDNLRKARIEEGLPVLLLGENPIDILMNQQ